MSNPKGFINDTSIATDDYVIQKEKEGAFLFFLLLFLVRRNTVSKNLIIPNRILALAAAITGIALNGVDNAVFAFLHDTDMIGLTILRARRAFIIPIEENDLSCRRFKAAILPLATVLEPLHTIDTCRKFRNNAAVDIAAFIGTPGNKAGAPLHAGIESVP